MVRHSEIFQVSLFVPIVCVGSKAIAVENSLGSNKMLAEILIITACSYVLVGKPYVLGCENHPTNVRMILEMLIKTSSKKVSD
jgi:hypothetical protein